MLGNPDQSCYILVRNKLAHATASSRANHLTITVPDRVTAIGTRINLETDKGKSDTRAVIGTVGMPTDQTPELSLGLGDREQVVCAVIQYPNGQTEVIPAPPINTKIRLQQGPRMDASIQ